MHHLAFLIVFITSLYSATAQAQAAANTTDSSSRKALLKGMVAKDRGAISAIEPSLRQDGGVIIGYRGGTVMNCYGQQSCSEYGGTPAAAVQHIAVTMHEGTEVVWVTYPQGALYRCVSGHCNKFLWDGVQPR